MADLNGKGEQITAHSSHITQEVLLVFVIASSIILNFSVVFVICRNKHLRKITTNIFILNLVISNALMAIFVMPLSLASFIKLGWSIDSLLCKVRRNHLQVLFFFTTYSFFQEEIEVEMQRMWHF